MLNSSSSARLVGKCLSTCQPKFLWRSTRMVRPLYFSRYSSQSQKITLSYVEGSKNFEVLDKTFGQVIGESADIFADRILVHSVEQGAQLTYAEALQKADRLAAGLLSLGLQRGDRVALWAPNTWEWIVLYFALARAGLISVAMNPLLVGEDAKHCLSLTKVAAVIAPTEHKNNKYLEMLQQMAPELRDAKPGTAKCSAFPNLRAAISISGKVPGWAVGIDTLSASVSESDIAKIKDIQAEISPEDAAFFQFSSGTTGKPKAVVISHKSYTNNGRSCSVSLSHDPNKPAVYCVQVPLFHAFGLVAVISCAVQLGGQLVLPSAFYSPKAHLRAHKDNKCTVLTGTPTMYLDLIRQTEKDGQPSHSPEVSICGGAPLVPQLGRDIFDVLKVKRLHAIYGLSETTAAAFLGTKDDTFEQMCNTVGKASARTESKVVDKDGNIVPVNTPGELWVRGYLNMTEYFDQPNATSECTTPDGWIKTGDQFIIDENGYGKVIGRFKDIIIRGGENISPKEIEDILTTHPSIVDAQVVGVKDERLGEDICACLIVREPVGGELIKEICKDKLSKFKIPRYYIIVDGYPKTTSGKYQKHKIRDNCNKLRDEGKLLQVNI